MASTLRRTKSTTEPVGVAHPQGDLKIVKAASDRRMYHHVVMPNGLKCLLIADPCSERDAVSLCIPIGYVCDPAGWEGLSNLLCRAIHSGKGYVDFVDFVSQNEGSVKSETLSERACFSFEVNCNVLSEALARFAKVFVNPLDDLNVDILEANCSETIDDSSLLNKMQKFLTSTSHPYHKSWKGGDMKSVINKQGFLDEIKRLYATSVSANLMSLVVFVKDKSFDEVEALIGNYFTAVHDLRLEPFLFPSPPCSEEFVQILVRVLPTNGSHSMRIQWPLIHNIDNTEEFCACQYLSFLFSHKGEGSLFHALTERGWATQVHGSEHDRNSNFSFFSVNIELTDSAHFEDVCGLVFNFIKKLRKAGPRKYIFEKVQSMTGLNGRSLINYVDKISLNLLVFPIKDCLFGTYPLAYSVTGIRKIVNQLTLDNVRLFWVSKTFQGLANFDKELDGVSYCTEPLSPFLVEEWMKRTMNVNLHLPSKEDLISNASLKEVHKDSICHNIQRVLHSAEDQNNHAPHDLVERKVCIIFDERMVTKHIPSEPHDEAPKRVRAIQRKFQQDGLFQRCAVYGSERAKLKHLIQVHDDDHITRILLNKLSDCNIGNKDMYMSDDSSEAIFLAAGGAVKACRMVATGQHQHAFAVVRPPGHHAKKSVESGFCFFNNIAVGTKYLLSDVTDHEVKKEIKKVLIIDWDIHFGDGTFETFADDKQVLFISIHRHPYAFPQGSSGSIMRIGEGDATGYNCNVCWTEGGANDDDLFAVFDYIVMPLAREFDPDIVLISGGFDAALNDFVGDCFISPKGFATALQKLLTLEKGIVLILEGGYNPKVVAECSASCVKVLCGDSIEEPVEYFPHERTWHCILQVRQLLAEYWNSLKSPIPPEVLARKWTEPPAQAFAPRKPKYPKPLK